MQWLPALRPANLAMHNNRMVYTMELNELLLTTILQVGLPRKGASGSQVESKRCCFASRQAA